VAPQLRRTPLGDGTVDPVEQLGLKTYYGSLTDQALDQAYCVGPEGYRDSSVWQIVEDEYSARGLLTVMTQRHGSPLETYYDVLGIPKDANDKQVKVGYRAQALRWHPDRNNGSAESEERFKRLAEAYQVLSNPQHRRTYDQSLASGGWIPPTGASIDFRAAANLFAREMADLATELALRNMRPDEIQVALRKRGCPALLAARLGRDATSWRENSIRQSVWEDLRFRFIVIPGILVVLLMLIFGSSGVERLLIYLLIVGGPLIYYLITGRAPLR